MRLPNKEEIESLKLLSYQIKKQDADLKRIIAIFECEHANIVELCEVPHDAIYSLTDCKWQIIRGQSKVDLSMDEDGNA